MAISLNKIKNRKPSQPKTTEEILAEQYRYYFYHNPNRTEYVNKYDDTIQGECMVLDVSSANPEASGDEKNLTTLPNSGIEVGMILNLKFAEGKETWVVTNKEHLAVKSHDKYKISPLHHEGILIKSDFTEEVIDIKMTNNNSKPEVKHMYYSPINRVHCGDYILIDGLYYLVQDIQNNLDLPYCVAIECNQKLTAKVWDREIPCRIENSSYGSKGEITNYSQISDFDSRANIQVQVNKYTKMLYEGFRQIFNNSKSDVYEITKIQSVFGDRQGVGEIGFVAVEIVLEPHPRAHHHVDEDVKQHRDGNAAADPSRNIPEQRVFDIQEYAGEHGKHQRKTVKYREEGEHILQVVFE